MDEEIFRKKSLDRVKSPDNLDEYIRVTNPGIWLLLVSIIVLLAGACVWAAFGRVDSTVAAHVRAEDGAAVCYVSAEDLSSVQEGMTVRFDDREAVITGIGPREDMGYPCELRTEGRVPDGTYEGKIVIESVKPISFVLN